MIYKNESRCNMLLITFVNYICKQVNFIMKYKLITFASKFDR